jgi:Flp pilus assembly protein TadG
MLIHLTRFLKNCRGGVAPMMGFLAIPLMGSVGIAVDYSRASSAKSAFQGALDSTALMLQDRVRGRRQTTPL